MNRPFNIRFVKDTTLYPNNPAVQAEVTWREGGASTTVTWRREEYDLMVYVHHNPVSDRLWDLIEGYGEMKYNEAAQDAAEDAAGADL